MKDNGKEPFIQHVAVDLALNVKVALVMVEASLSKVSPGGELILFMSAFDKDPRDLWEIPEAREVWIKVGEYVNRRGFQENLNQESYQVIGFCIKAELGHKLTRDPDEPYRIIITPPDVS